MAQNICSDKLNSEYNQHAEFLIQEAAIDDLLVACIIVHTSNNGDSDYRLPTHNNRS